MKSLRTSLRAILVAVFLLSGLIFAVALWKLERGAAAETAELRGRLSQAGQEKVEASAGARGLETVRPAARAAGDAIAAMQARVLRASQDPAIASPQARKGKAFEAYAESGRELWGGGLTVLDAQGKTAGAWPEKFEDKDSARAFQLLRQQGDAAGQVYLFGETFDSRLKKMVSLVVVGLKGGGMLEARVPVKGMLEPSLAPSLKNLAALSGHSTFYLVRGSGKVAFAAPAEADNAEPVLAALFNRAILGRMAEAENGWMPSVRSGLKGLVVWSRVFPWDLGQGAESLQVAAVFLPWADFESARSTSLPAQGSHFFLWLLVAGAVLIPLFLAGSLVGRALEPLVQSAEAVQGLQSGRLEIGFPETKAWEVQELQKGIQTLIDRLRSDGSRQYRDESSEDRAMREALEKAGLELSGERSRAEGLQAEKEGLAAKLGALETELQEAETRAQALRSAARKMEAKELELQEALRSSEDALREIQARPPQTVEREVERVVERVVQVEVPAPERPRQAGPEKIRLEAIQALSTDLKSTLAVIRNYVNTMLADSGAISGPQQEFLGVVINKSARLERLVNDLQDLSQIEVRVPEMAAGDLAGLVEGLVMNARAQAETKRVNLTFEADAGLPEVRFNTEKLSQAVNTLLTQAVKVSPSDGQVTVGLKAVPSGVELRVTDSGTDLASEKAARVFTDFHGIDTQAGPEFIGSGLRFTILRAIVETHLGTVRLETGSGSGKSFVVTLPAAAGAPALPSLKPDGLLQLLKKEKPAAPSVSLPPLPSLGAPTPPAAGGLSSEELSHFSSIFADAPKPKPETAPVVPAQAPAVEDKLSKDEFANFASIFGDKKETVAEPVKSPAIPSPSLKESGLPPRPEVALAKEDLDNFASIFGAPASSGQAPAAPPASPAPAPVAEEPKAAAPKVVKGLGSLDDLAAQIKQGEAKTPKRTPKGGL